MAKSKVDQRSDTKSKKRKILIADESITIQKLVNLTFADPSVEVITASDGPDALTKVKRLQPDIVLADTQLRQVDGLQICESIRSDPSLSQVRVVLLKGKVTKDFEEKLANANVDEILSKPFDAKALAGVVDRLLMDEASTVVKSAGPFSMHTTAQQKLDAVAAEIIDESDESETVTKKLPTDESQDVNTIQDNEQSVTVKTERLRPSREESSFHEPLVVKALHEMRSSAETPMMHAVDSGLVEKVARDQIQEWIDKNLNSIAEKILKEEIARLTSAQ